MSTEHPEVYVAKGDTFMKPCYVNHPCNVWLRESQTNVIWLLHHLDGLCLTTKLRHYKWCPRYSAIRSAIAANTDVFQSTSSMTPVAQCMPDYLRDITNHVRAYRTYYAYKERSMYFNYSGSSKRPMFLG